MENLGWERGVRGNRARGADREIWDTESLRVTSTPGVVQGCSFGMMEVWGALNGTVGNWVVTSRGGVPTCHNSLSPQGWQLQPQALMHHWRRRC